MSNILEISKKRQKKDLEFIVSKKNVNISLNGDKFCGQWKNGIKDAGTYLF